MILTIEDLDGDPVYDDYVETEEQQAKEFSERLKKEICTLIDSKTSASLNEMFRQRDACDQLIEAQRYLGVNGQTLVDRIKDLSDENRKLKQQIKDTDEMLLAKRHYHPIMIKLLDVAQARNDIETVNRIHCFMLEGKII